ncbi:MAG: sodium:solute symporter, partial [Thermoguttaceae bacterium]
GWDVRLIIIAVGGLTALYSMIGGIAGVIWTDAVQSVILIAGAVTCAVLLLCNMPEGPGQIFRIAAENQKFSWGSWSLTDLQTSTFWVVFWYGMAINLQNFGIDQNYVQRYHTARSDAEAKKSVWLGAILYLPISAFFLFIGTALFAFYTARPELITDPQLAADIAAGKGDGVFPFFIVHQLPVGVTGLLIAAILAAAMSTIGTSMNGCATLTLSDFYTRFFRKNASQREQMLVLHVGSIAWGLVGMGCALLMIRAKGILDAYWLLAGIFSGGMVGLFLLGFLSRSATKAAALTGAIVGILVITWMTLSMPKVGLIPEAFRCPLNELLITVCGTLAILVTGFAVTVAMKKRVES